MCVYNHPESWHATPHDTDARIYTSAVHPQLTTHCAESIRDRQYLGIFCCVKGIILQFYWTPEPGSSERLSFHILSAAALALGESKVISFSISDNHAKDDCTGLLGGS